ncbi:hypothetical protein [Thermotalea metallivorans]|uniref:Uncharacterized protein n=1 Tax=Thermotalea metallivorans TaxID=520762 RepID=A0A140KZJ9_9FIRM|nr:hypothetical protein [Thermotalea metallivorans]KXG73724.1 hypothetical protein AN619_29420 [Thermotalea metallivorans]
MVRVEEIKKNLSNQKGGAIIWLMIVIIAFVAVSALVLDFTNLYIKAKQVKLSLNRSVKAGSLAILEGEQLANGNFLIDTGRAENNFRKILAHNLGLNESTLEPLAKSVLSEKLIIKEFAVENNTPAIYYSGTLKRNFNIENPSVIAVVEVKIRGVFLQKKMRLSKLSSSQLISIY